MDGVWNLRVGKEMVLERCRFKVVVFLLPEVKILLGAWRS
jgi:hypothetical protein